MRSEERVDIFRRMIEDRSDLTFPQELVGNHITYPGVFDVARSSMAYAHSVFLQQRLLDREEQPGFGYCVPAVPRGTIEPCPNSPFQSMTSWFTRTIASLTLPRFIHGRS
ncbi:MAG: hypothetical protein JW395_1073 [Nitrospira sp.]|nr:hypothetical protein [Nitrospira sp.]